MFIDLRNLGQTLLAISVLAMGLPMMAAVMGLLGANWNFANFFAMPILIGTNATLPSRTANTPSASFRVCPGLSSTGAAGVAAGRLCSLRRGFTTLPFAS